MKPIKKILSHISKIFSQIVSFPSKLLPSRWIRRMNTDQRRVFNLAVTGIVVVVGTWTISSLLAPDRSEASWFDDSWLYRRTVTAANNSPFTAENVPYRILMDTATPIAAGKMKTDGSDIRIVNNQGNVVRFQVEKSTLNTTETGIWFEANIEADNSATYYIYYGNSSATTPSFPSDIESNVNDGTTVTTIDGFEYTTTTEYARVNMIKKDGTNVGVGGHMKQTGSLGWWSVAAFTRTQLASGPLFVEIDFSDSNKGHYSTFGNRVKIFKNGFIEEETYLDYNNTGSEYLYYYLSFTNGTRNSVWVNASETLVDQAANSGGLNRAALGHNWFGQRWTDTGNYGGTIISPDVSDWNSGQTSAQNSYYQTNYSTTESYATGSARLIRFGTFAGTGTVNEMHEKASLLGAQSTTLSSEEAGPSPIAYWSMDEGSGTTVKDNTQNGNNGNISGATWQEESMCLKGRCLYFDGTDDQVTFGDINNIPLTGDLTISFWIKPTNIAKGRQNPLGKAYGGEFDFTLETSGSLSYYHGSAGGDTSPYTSLGSSAISQNQWTHVVVTRDTSTRTITYFINGQQDTTKTYTSSYDPSDSSRLLRFGYEYAGFFQGYLDEVKIYANDRTLEQIKTDFNSGSAAVLGAKDANLNNGLVGYWKMDEDSTATASAQDASGNGNTGTATGTLATTGQYGNGRDFDGTDDYINIPDSSSVSPTTALTVSTWIYGPLSTQISAAGIISKDISSGISNPSYSLQVNGAGTIAFMLTDSTNGASTISTSGLQDNKWYNIIGTYDGSVMRLYINGELKTTGTKVGNISDTTGTLKIGQQKENSNRWFNGTLDETRLYNRALSSSEVQQLYNYAPPPVAYYDFEEGSGTSALDKSGNGLTGTWNGTGSRHYTSGKYGKAANFNGIDDHISVSANAILNPTTITVSAWAKSNTATWNESGFIVSQRNNYMIHPNSGATSVNFYIYTTTWNSVTCTPPDITKWNYYTLSWDGTTLRCYVNGVQGGATAVTGPINTTSSALTIGRDSGIARFMNGSIDEVRIYNYARTPGQIIEDMNAGHPIVGSPVGSQVGYWKLDEGTGTTVYDNAPGRNNGTLTGATWSNSGKLGKALSFDGNDYVTLGNITAYKIDTKTISFWAKPTVTPSGTVILFGNGSSNYYVGLSTSNRLFVSHQTASATQQTTASPNNVITINEWHHYTVKWEVSGDNVTITMFKDGKQVSQTVYTTGYGTSYGSNFILGGLTSTSNLYTGLLDEVKFYNTALTEEQIKLDYNSGKSLQFGVLGTEADGTPSNSSDRAYCPPGDTTATCGPIAEWLFEEGQGTTTADTSGNGYNGTLTNGPTWTRGKVGSSLQFDGTNDFVNTGTSGPSLTTMTLAAWININEYTTSYRSGIISRRSDTGLNFDISGDLESAGRVGVYEGGSAGIWGNTVLPKGKWHYVAAVLDGSNITLYVNGKKDGSGTLSWTWTNGKPITIGSIAGSSGYYFNGLIDQAQLYNYALSPSQVAWNYNKGAPVAHYDFDECQGSTVHSFTKPYNPALNGTITIGATGTQTSAGTCQTTGTAWGNGASGKYGGSLNFDGTDDYVSIPGGWLYDYQTVSFWAKDIWSDATGRPISSLHFVNPDHDGFFFNAGTNSMGVTIYNNNQAEYNASASVMGTSWHHFVVTWTPTESKYYVDGVLRNSTTRTNDFDTNTTDMDIGRYNYQDNNYFSGQIDDVKIFNYALTPLQIKNVYNNGAVYFGQ